MLLTKIIFATVCWSCALIIGCIALWAFKRRDPMHFWSGSSVSPDEIDDIPAYNRANGWMWTIYTIFTIIAGICSLFSITVGAVLLVLICFPGIIVLIVAYKRIYRKYRSDPTSITGKTAEFPKTSKAPKFLIITTIAVSGIIIAVVSVMLMYGAKEPVVNILDNQIQIKAMYGVDINFSEIKDISLIEKSMSDIGVGTRVNGYGGVGETLKGNFKSDSLGETLLFVQSKSVPTIKIERTGKKDIYLSFTDAKETERLYLEIASAVPLEK